MTNNNFLNALAKQLNWTVTENGQSAYESTGNPLLDFVSLIGAYRQRDFGDVIGLFQKAYLEDPLHAVKALFWLRDIRGGNGERDLFRIILHFLAINHPEHVRPNMAFIAEYGRFDDYYALVETPLEDEMFSLLKEQFDQDLENMGEGRPVSLLAKWLKSINSSDEQTRLLGRMTAKAFGLSYKEYRKAVASLRAYLKVVETKLSAGKFGEIDYPSVPSYCMKRNRNTFVRHDEERFSSYIRSVSNGEEKINSSTLYPYDLFKQALLEWGDKKALKVINEQWKSLPDFVEGEHNFLVMADVSGSMHGDPLAISVSLAIYFAQRNKGAFHGEFMTFSERPKLVKLKEGASFTDLIPTVLHAGWGLNTNLNDAMESILQTAIDNHLPQEELPDALIVISDMEIDEACEGELFTNHFKLRFKQAGYVMPKIIYWNVCARHNVFHADAQNDAVRFISGASASSFGMIAKHMSTSPIGMVIEMLDDDRYGRITLG